MMQSKLIKATVFGAALLMPSIYATTDATATVDQLTPEQLEQREKIQAAYFNKAIMKASEKSTTTVSTESNASRKSLRARSVSDPFRGGFDKVINTEEEKVGLNLERALEEKSSDSVLKSGQLTQELRGKLNDIYRQGGPGPKARQPQSFQESKSVPPPMPPLTNNEGPPPMPPLTIQAVQEGEAGHMPEEALTVEDLLKRLEAQENSSTNTKVITGVVGAGLLIGGAAAAVGEGVKVVEKLGLEKFQEQNLGDTNMISFTIGVIAAALGLFILTGLGSHALFGFNPYFWVIQFSILGFMVCSIGGAFSTEIHSLSTGFVDAAHTIGHELGIEGAHHADVNMFFVVSLCFAAGVILLPLLVFGLRKLFKC